MKEIKIEQVKMLLNGTKVFVKCVGSDWQLDESQMNTWNVKQDDGLHYEFETEDNTISFPYNFDYSGNEMDVLYFIDDETVVHLDEFGNKVISIDNIMSILDDMDLSENDFHTLQNIKNELEKKMKK